MPGARLSDNHDDGRPADPGVDVEVPDLDEPPAAAAAADEPPVDEAPEEQEDA